MWSKLIVSASDFALNLIVAMISTSGLLWLAGTAQTYNPSMSTEEIQKQLDKKAEENGHLRDQGEKAKHEADKLAGEANSKKAPHPDMDASRERGARAKEAFERSQEEGSRLDEELRRLLLLNDELEREKEQSEQARKESEALRKKLLERSREVNLQREEIAKIKHQIIQRPIVSIDIAPVFSTDARKPVFVLLSQGSVTPVREPYYSITQFSDGEQRTLVRRGDAVDLALSAGSDFQKLLGEINTRTQYVYLLVDSSSFETFRAIREELRGRDISLGWEPTEATTLTFLSNRDNAGVVPGITR